MEIRFNVTAEEQRVFREARHGPGKKSGSAASLVAGLAALGLAGVGLVRWEQGDGGWQALELLFVALLLLVSGLVDSVWRRFGRPYRRLERGEYRMILTPPGLAVTSPGGPEFVPWPDIQAFVETEDCWFLHRTSREGYRVPKTALPDSPGRTEFAERVRTLWRAHPENQGRLLGEGLDLPRRRWRTLADLATNLAGGYRFAVFRPATPADFKADAVQLALLLALQLLMILGTDYAVAEADTAFDAGGFNDYGASVALFLLGGVAVGAVLGSGAKLLGLLVMLAASALTAFCVHLLIHAAILQAPVDSEWALPGLYGAWIVWTLSLAYRAVVLRYDCPWPAALVPVAFFALFNLALAHALPSGEFFVAAEAVAEGVDMDGEDLVYRQPELLEDTIGSLEAGRPGVTDLYFVGFAGDAEQRVFAHEIEYAKDLFDRRFGTAGRSVALVNSPATAGHLALASGHSLYAVLQAVADRMDRDEDILFLFLTSHGSADHRLSVQFPSLPLNDLSAADLKDLLDQSGIRNRVIVVSACYSGGFLDLLKNDDSLILTAASRDHTSFGCSTEAEFTYFGQAYFVEALQHSRSFVDAFDQARIRIEAREKREGKEPSLPQRHVGAGILSKLRALEAGAAPKS